VCIPTCFSGNHTAFHCSITRNHIFNNTSQHMTNVRLSVCCRRAVIKNIIRTSFPLFHTFLKNVIVVPKLFDLFFSIDKIHVCRNFFVHDLLPFLLNNKKLPSCNRTKAYSPFLTTCYNILGSHALTVRDRKHLFTV